MNQDLFDAYAPELKANLIQYYNQLDPIEKKAYKIAKENDTIIVDIGNYNEISIKGEFTFENTKNIKFIVAGFSDEIYSKTPLPTNEKVSPTIFYIKNDKPIDRDTYLRNLQNEVDRK
jgi:hypothetical protein